MRSAAAGDDPLCVFFSYRTSQLECCILRIILFLKAKLLLCNAPVRVLNTLHTTAQLLDLPPNVCDHCLRAACGPFYSYRGACSTCCW